MPPKIAKETTMVKQFHPIEDINTKYTSQLVNHGYPRDGQIGINELNVGYIQRNDTCGDSDLWQQLRLEAISTEFEEKENVDSFIRMRVGKKTPDECDIEDFWSINGLEDLVSIFNNFERRRGSTIHYKVIKEVTYPDGTVHTGTFE